MAASAAKTMNVIYGVVCLLFFAGVLGTGGYMLYQDGGKALEEWKVWASKSSATGSKNGPLAGSSGKARGPGMFLPLRSGRLGKDYQANAMKQFQKVQDAINSSGDGDHFPGISSNPIPGMNTFSTEGAIPGSAASLPRSTGR